MQLKDYLNYTIICPNCNQPNEKGAKFCISCGQHLIEEIQIDTNENKKSIFRRIFVFFFLTVLFTSLLFGIINFSMAKVRDIPLANQVADTLRFIFGFDFVKNLEKDFYTKVEKKYEKEYENENIILNQEAVDKLSKSFDVYIEELAKANFPPSDIIPIINKPSLSDEGVWKASEIVKDKNSEAIFYESIIRPDVIRPWAKVLLVIADMRKLKLNFIAGTKCFDSKGSGGTGIIPEDDIPFLVADFNGGFQQRHDNGAMISFKKSYGSLKYDKGSIFVFDDGSIDICRYSKEKEQEYKEKGKVIVHARQNQPPLIENGIINKDVKQWGWVWPDKDTSYGHRSGIGILNNGHIVFAAGNSLSAQTLAQALKLAGCVNAIHLDMNQGHIAFNYYNEDNGKLKAHSISNNFTTTLVGRYLKGYERDFFYFTVNY